MIEIGYMELLALWGAGERGLTVDLVQDVANDVAVVSPVLTAKT